MSTAVIIAATTAAGTVIVGYIEIVRRIDANIARERARHIRRHPST